MGLKLKLTGLLLVAIALTTTVVAIDLLKGTTYWDVAEVTSDITSLASGESAWKYEIEDYHPVPWHFTSNDANAKTGTVEASGYWVGIWNEVGPCTIYCQMTSGSDKWYVSFVNPRFFIAYRGINNYAPYRFGQIRGSGAQPSSASSAITPAPSNISMEQDTDRPGMNYRNYATSPDPQICANDCANDPSCKAFTYVKPGVRGSNSVPECWLKNGVPNPVSGECCVSGVK